MDLNKMVKSGETNNNNTSKARNSGPAKTDKRAPMSHGIKSNPTMGGGINRALKPTAQKGR